MATKKKTPKKPAKRKPAPAKYVVVTVGDKPVWFQYSGIKTEPAYYTMTYTLDDVLRNAKVRLPAVGESVTIVIHGTTAKGFIGGDNGEELPQIGAKP